MMSQQTFDFCLPYLIQVDEAALAYRRASLQVDPVRARVQAGLPLIDNQHGVSQDSEGNVFLIFVEP